MHPRQYRRWIVVAAVVVVVVVIVVLKVGTREQTSKADPGIENKYSSGKGSEGQNLPSLIDLGSARCIPCVTMAPILEELKEEYRGKATIKFIDVGKNRAAIQKYRVRVIPTQVFFDAEGKEVWRHEGGMSKEEIVAKLKEMGVE